MKVCFFITSIEGKGGTERVTTTIANALVDRGIDVSIVSCSNSEKAHFFLDEKVSVYTLHDERITNPVRKRTYKYKLLLKYVRHENIDIIIAVGVHLYAYFIPLQFMRICKCIAWDHFNFYVSGKSKRDAFIQRLAVKFSDQLVVLGKNDFTNYISELNAKKVSLIYNPLTTTITRNKGFDSHRIVAAGNLSYAKGFDLLLEAWTILENRDIKDWTLEIYGTGEEEETLKQIVEKNNLKKAFLCGFTECLDEELEDASLFVLSSRHECFVLVLLEAQAKGLPCVSFDCRESPAEIIEDGVNGLLAKAENVEDLAEKMWRIMSDEYTRKKFAENSQKGLYRFNIDVVISCWINLFDKIIGMQK